MLCGWAAGHRAQHLTGRLSWTFIVPGMVLWPMAVRCLEGVPFPNWHKHLGASLRAQPGAGREQVGPTGLPANAALPHLSVMCHCQRRGSQLLLGQECHLHVFEQGGVAQIAGVHSHPLPDLPRRTLDLAELERMVTRGLGSPYHPVCELICLENTHSSSGGRVLPVDYLRQVQLLARSHRVRVHLDGARLMNATVALHVPPARIVEHCDSVSLCFSKGLGAPVGALVGGPKNFIEEAWRLRKALGGGMRQAGVLAAAALVGLADFEEVLQRDHQNAQRFAKERVGQPLSHEAWARDRRMLYQTAPVEGLDQEALKGDEDPEAQRLTDLPQVTQLESSRATSVRLQGSLFSLRRLGCPVPLLG
ncbi:probable low-specificity L-threonine aldolase 1 [Mustela putorius furo]|uniref:Probable low-specificity L-threonine aldolase 1 n=1 Tax=Mustela putorius furo TaxID=9669 RepID=A0A8U0TD22_MUSPF|nr:probable low-specificity L-threonine aldolase 1 [Mustela putorius furo]